MVRVSKRQLPETKAPLYHRGQWIIRRVMILTAVISGGKEEE